MAPSSEPAALNAAEHLYKDGPTSDPSDVQAEFCEICTQEPQSPASPSEQSVCAICLGDPRDAVRVCAAGHEMCAECIRSWLNAAPSLNAAPCCPTCKGTVDAASLESAGISLPVATAVARVDDAPPPPVDQRADRAFRRFARHVNLRACPRCSAPIEKNGGCPQMCCYACRFQFRWHAARNSSQSGANL